MRKQIIPFFLAASIATVSMSVPAYAAGWKRDSTGWWWQNDDGSWPANSWQWLDGNRDGVSECYYFNSDGYMLAAAKTPDNYEVNADGAWVDGGTVQVQYARQKQNPTYLNTTSNYERQVSNLTNSKNANAASNGEQQVSDPASPNGAGAVSDYRQQVLDLVNEERRKVGAGSLAWDDALAECANVRAEEITRLFSHSRPDGTSCYTVFSANGVSYGCAGENIAAGQRTPAAVMEAWMNSSGHKKNILNTAYGRLGVGFYQSSDSYGYYWVQMFTD